MSKIRPFTTVNGIEVLLDPGNLSFEPSLYFIEGDKLVKMTLSSNEYENELGEFRFHSGLGAERRATAELIMHALADQIRQIGHWTDFTLKPVYHEKLMAVIDALIESKEYYDI